MAKPVTASSGSLPPAIQGCLEACRRCEALVGLTVPGGSPGLAYAAIKQHLRHCVDHYQCFLQSLESGTVDYDARDRSELLAQDPERMQAALASIATKLRAIDPATFTRKLDVVQSASCGTPALTVESNLERELIFLSGHTIHHIAIMAILADRHGVKVPEELSVAFSTAAYLDRMTMDSG